jgi:5-methylthioadenosine/S-adenosylhomocysteine deaminase
MILYQADWICPASSPPIRNGAMAVEDGRIVKIYSHAPPDSIERIAWPGCAIIPGFVNAHTHLELTLFQGLLEGLTFADWIASLVRMKYQLCSPEDLKISARLGAIEMLHAGVTAVGEVMDSNSGWEAIKEFGLQGVAYQEVFGPANDTAADALQALGEKVTQCRRQETETQRIGVSPHAPFSVSKALYEGARDFARREGLPMTAHIAESRAETVFVRDGAGPFAESHRRRNIAVVARGCLPVAYLDQLGLLGPDMLLIHVIETDTEDLNRIRDTGTFVVHCPKSNAMLGHGVARVADMRRRGVPVALGTDGLGSNDAIDMFAEMRAVVAQQALPFDDVFRMATIDGARALGLAEHLGSLEEGRRADFAVVALRNAKGDPVEDMIRFAGRANVKATYIGGREVVVEEEALRDEVRRIRARLSA